MITSPGGGALCATLDRPAPESDRCVILLHCFLCTKEHRVMRALSEALNGMGISTIRFDFGGNGQSPGRLEDQTYTKMLGDVGAMARWARDLGFKSVGVAGHSLGAMLSLLYAHTDPSIKSVAFISGSSEASRVRAVFPPQAVSQAEREGRAETMIYNRGISITRDFILDTERYNVGHAAAILDRPFLIIHGTDDEVIPLYHARQLHAWAGKRKRFIPFEGADHQYKSPGSLDRLKEEIALWFEETL